MANIPHSTYTNGFEMTASRAVAKREFAACLRGISDALATMHEAQVSVEAEGTAEGGIVFCGAGFGAARGAPYKSMRIGALASDLGRSYKWPWIAPTTMADWGAADDADALFPAGLRIGTYLKAFGGAPRWTQAELDLFAAAFEGVGFRVKNPRVTRL